MCAGEADPDQRDAKGRTALMLIAESGDDPRIMEMFLAKLGAAPDLADQAGETALFKAALKPSNPSQ